MRYFQSTLYRDDGEIPVICGYSVSRSRETNWQTEVTLDSVQPAAQASHAARAGLCAVQAGELLTTAEEDVQLRTEAYHHHLRQ